MTALPSADKDLAVPRPDSRQPITAVPDNRLPLLFAFALVLIGGAAALYIYSGCCIVFRVPIRADGFGYYAYLPAYFIDHNLTMKTALAYRWTVVTKPLGYIWYGLHPYAQTGNLLDKYTLGTALLQVPSFLAAYVVAHILGMPPYSTPYQAASVVSALLFFGVGGFLLLRNLQRRHRRPTSLLAALAVIFGTSVFHYATFEGSYSHIYSFFMFALLISVADNYRIGSAASSKPLLGYAFGFGAILGVIALLRVPNAIAAIIPLALIGERFRRNRNQSAVALECAALAAGFLLLFMLQMAYWHAVTGHYLVNSYQGEGFNWLHPQVADFLFSIRKGVFFWSPILLIAVIGLPRFVRSERVLGIAVCIVLALEVYACSSWWSWWFGDSFGARPVTDMMPLIALPMASGVAWMQDRAGRWTAGVIVAVLIVLNLFLMVSYWRELIPWDKATAADFAHIPVQWEEHSLLLPDVQRALALRGTYSLGTPFLADAYPPPGMWIEGISRPAPAIWTVERIAALYFRPELPPKGDLQLDVTLANPAALVTSQHPRQRAIVRLNDTPVGTITVIFGHANRRWMFILPRKRLQSGEIARIDFELPDAVAPKQLETGSDTRLLGLYISRIDILSAGML